MKPAAYKWNLATLDAIATEAQPESGPYSAFRQVDGSHPWKFAVPNGFIDYQARILRGSRILFFNFDLAKEMGLIPQNHPSRLNKDLEKALISTFALRIINEFDQLSGEQYPARDLKPNRYMATRYLQLQHNCKKGNTSGDGRSIWNGQFISDKGVAWDISSCGTGVTRLSPGFVQEGRPIKSGDPLVSYGSGLADVDEGLTAAILSESFHRRGILTERTLAVIEAPGGRGINVRAACNLLRPSHLFLHLKQGNQLMLKRSLDFYIAKQRYNREWPVVEADKYDHFLSRIAKQYGEFVARLEDEYIFCWLDWDGDNMLLDGGIIDYGSIRQFGLCHHKYRYDDVERFSTNLKEQERKARGLVQTFVQLVDFVRTGEKKQLQQFSSSPILQEFDRAYKAKKCDLLLTRCGLSANQRKMCLERRPKLVEDFEKSYRFFERRESPRGMRKVADGINSPAIFCTRSLLKELPKSLLMSGRALTQAEFLSLMKTSFLTKKEMANSGAYAMPVIRFQRCYLDLLKFAYKGKPFKRSLLETAMRSSQQNRSGYVTGDGIIHVVNFLLSRRQSVSRNDFIALIEGFIKVQQGIPLTNKLKAKTRRLLNHLLAIVEENKFSL